VTRQRLLIDASAAFNQGAGIGRYARELLRSSLPDLAKRYDVHLWYASDDKGPAKYLDMAMQALSQGTGVTIARSAFSRRRIDQLSRLPVDLPARLLVGRADLAYSPDFTLPASVQSCGLVTVHDLAFEIIPQAYPPGLLRYLQNVVPRNVRAASRVAVVSRTTRIDVIERYNIAAERVVVIPNAVDKRFFERPRLDAETQLALGLPDRYLLAVGTIEPRKNYATLLAAQQLAFASVPCPLVIVGRSGWHNASELATIAAMKQHGSVIPLLDLPDEHLPAVYAAADATVYVPLYEGFGLPVLEAMASGTTVITSDIPSVREVAAGHAIIVPPLDVEAVAHAMSSAAPASETKRAELQAAAEFYRWTDSATLLVKTIEEMSRQA
jgi:glycosyltransferase involved in cell wall biosynthesis